MIKLIASDMDGTLLDPDGKLPTNFHETLTELNNRDVQFIVASGRPYKTLRENFKPISDNLYFICDNGSYVVEKGNIINVSIIDKTLVNKVITLSEGFKDINVILCGLNGTYHTRLNDGVSIEVKKYYLDLIEVNDLLAVDDDIFKITIYDKKVSAKNSYKFLEPEIKTDLAVVVSGEHWLDINNPEISKGAALEVIQKRDNITSCETMVFGDNFNDVSMLKKAHYSFVMENATEKMKDYGNYIAKSNSENGVIHAINKYVLI